MRLARRLAGIAASPTMVVMEEARNLRAQGIDVIDLGPGQPDFPTPDSVKEAGIAAIRDDFTTYTHAAGIQPLRRAVAEKYNREWGTAFADSNVVIASGGKHAIFNACLAVFEDGQEVLNPVPYWVTFPEVIKLAGARPVEVPTRMEEGFVLTASAVEKAVTPRTRGLIVNTPNNPTGAVIPRDGLADIVTLARDRSLFLLADETYERFTYGGVEHASLAAFVGERDLDYCIVGSLSKTYSMTGWRIGYGVGPADLMERIVRFQSHQTGNPCSISQKAALTALTEGQSDFERMRLEYGRRRDFVLRRLQRIRGVSCVGPDGAFYVFPHVRVAMDKVGCGSSIEFASFLLREAQVAVVPGSAFGVDDCVRLSYAASMDRLSEGLDRIDAALGRHARPRARP
jgi:aspartate aminotransferase